MNRRAASFGLEQETPVQYVTVGKKGRDFLARAGQPLIADYTMPDYPSMLDTLAAKAYWRALDRTPEFVVLFVPGLYTPDTPMANLLVTMLDHVGVPIAKLGDSTGQLLLDYQQAGATPARG